MKETEEVIPSNLGVNGPHIGSYANNEYFTLQNEPVIHAWIAETPRPHRGVLALSLALLLIILAAIFDWLGAGLITILVLCGNGVLLGCLCYFLDDTELIHYSMTDKGIYFIRKDLMQKSLGYVVIALSIALPFMGYSLYGLYGSLHAILALACWGGLRFVDVREKYRHVGMLFTEGSGKLMVDRRNFSIGIFGRDSDIRNHMLVHCAYYNFEQIYKDVSVRTPNYQIHEVSEKIKVNR
ncbi:hypothetical protein [Plesiomonas shigelloides]|uniref:hypothetical protein n=1 Tax=Plesiomonas shigelloides TaxID=703 RepID=UPI00111C0D4C|nr:hypothetical protein [Plesiomonas shigelloides]